MNIESELKKLIKNLRRKATHECKKVGDDVTHFEGVCKGLWLGYDWAANDVEKLLKKYLDDKNLLK